MVLAAEPEEEPVEALEEAEEVAGTPLAEAAEVVVVVEDRLEGTTEEIVVVRLEVVDSKFICFIMSCFLKTRDWIEGM